MWIETGVACQSITGDALRTLEDIIRSPILTAVAFGDQETAEAYAEDGDVILELDNAYLVVRPFPLAS